MDFEKETPVLAGRAGLGGSPLERGGLSASLPLSRDLSNPGRLVDQARASERRAEANAAWHRERAGRYLAWCDSPWAAAQYDAHVREAAYQERLAARHRAVVVALQAVRP